MHKKSDFHWTTEEEDAFKQMKKIIAELPTLTAHIEKEELIVHLAAAKEAMSAVLMAERETKQMPVYFISRALQDGSRASLILTSPEGTEFTYTLRFRFDATNNKAEYKALIAGLRITEQIGVKNLQTNVHSRLVANQVNGSYIAKESGMVQYLEKVKALTRSFKKFPIKQKHSLWKKKRQGLYGASQDVIPMEIGMPTLRTVEIDMVQNDEALKINLDLLEERKEQAAIDEAKSKAKMEKYYNFKVRNTSFKPGDLMYRNNDVSHAKYSGKLSPKWEGPYEVTEALGNGAYKLRDRNGKLLLQT
nr:reverse transcriptase domain-containing protein [Tanacetum cinerariifolium]